MKEIAGHAYAFEAVSGLDWRSTNNPYLDAGVHTPVVRGTSRVEARV